MDIQRSLAEWARRFDAVLDELLASAESVPPVLHEAVRYAVQGGGKRLRPFLVTRFCELCGGSAESAEPAAAAIECIHAFSLVHDDLPSMDDDDLRRGRPTCHKVYGEAVAILAGDALCTLAFEILATRVRDPRVCAALVAELARGAGWAGMVGGQALDVLGEQQPVDVALVRLIHDGKTARLFESATRMGALSAGVTCATAVSAVEDPRTAHRVVAPEDDPRLDAAGVFGRQLGLAFQIADDLLDVTGDAAEVGKAVAKDAASGKQTYPAAVGVEASRKAAAEAARQAVAALAVLGPAADDLRALTRFVLERRR